MPIRDIIGPGLIGTQNIEYLVTRGFDSSALSDNKGWAMESLMLSLVHGGQRRYSVADSPTASTNKGGSFESLQAMITQGGARRK